jgi:sortase A
VAAPEGATPTHAAPVHTPPAGPANTEPDARDSARQERLETVPAPPPATTLGQTATITDTMSGTTGTPLPDPITESDPSLPTQLRIPRLKIDTRVREVDIHFDSWEWEVADFMAGHHVGTGVPGDVGNVVIAGHRDVRGSVFLNLDKVKKGDEIFVHSGRGVFRYVVRTTKIVKPTSVEVLAPTTDHRLTLITCTPVKLATHRIIVIADLDPEYIAPDRGE